MSEDYQAAKAANQWIEDYQAAKAKTERAQKRAETDMTETESDMAKANETEAHERAALWDIKMAIEDCKRRGAW